MTQLRSSIQQGRRCFRAVLSILTDSYAHKSQPVSSSGIIQTASDEGVGSLKKSGSDMLTINLSLYFLSRWDRLMTVAGAFETLDGGLGVSGRTKTCEYRVPLYIGQDTLSSTSQAYTTDSLA